MYFLLTTAAALNVASSVNAAYIFGDEKKIDKWGDDADWRSVGSSDTETGASSFISLDEAKGGEVRKEAEGVEGRQEAGQEDAASSSTTPDEPAATESTPGDATQTDDTEPDATPTGGDPDDTEPNATPTGGDPDATPSTTPEAEEEEEAESSTTSAPSTPSPYITILPDGSPSTITPFLTTVDGKTSTVSAAPAGATLVDSDADNQDSTSDDLFLECTSSKYNKSPSGTIINEPFCEPHNNTVWHVITGKEFYYITWNPEFYPENSTIAITLNYIDSPPSEPRGVWPSPDSPESSAGIPSQLGFTTITPQPSWLSPSWLAPGTKNLTLSFTIASSSSNSRPIQGPLITLTTIPKPPPVDTSPGPPNKLGIAIGLPVVLAFILLMVCGTHFCMRERRRIGPISIGGVRGRGGYGVRRSRRQRMKGASAMPKDGDEFDVAGGREYRDSDPQSPAGRGVANDWELTSVKGGPGTGGIPETGNAFRDEIARQQQGRA